jgi:hypothetical protein
VLAVAVVSAALAFPFAHPTHAADAKPAAPKPLRSVTVRVMPEEAFYGREEHFHISTLTATTCTVQVDQASLRAQGEPLLLQAFRACWVAKPEPAGCRTLTLEDGNKVRAVVLAGGKWDKAGCDQGKVKR